MISHLYRRIHSTEDYVPPEIQKLSDDLLYKIFTYLPKRVTKTEHGKSQKHRIRLAEMSLVCKHWKRIIEEHHVFQRCSFFSSEKQRNRHEMQIMEHSRRKFESTEIRFYQKSSDWSDDLISSFLIENRNHLLRLSLKFDMENSNKRIRKVVRMLKLMNVLEYLNLYLTLPDIREIEWIDCQITINSLKYLIIEPRKFLKTETSFKFLEYLKCPNIETLKISLDSIDQSKEIAPGVFSTDPEKFNILCQDLATNFDIIQAFINENGKNLKKISIDHMFDYTNYGNSVMFKASSKNLDLTELLLQERIKDVETLELNSIAYHRFYKFLLKLPKLSHLKIHFNLLQNLYGLLKMKQLKSVTVYKFQVSQRSVTNFYLLCRNLEKIVLMEPGPKGITKYSPDFQLFRMFKKLKGLQVNFSDGPVFEDLINFTITTQNKMTDSPKQMKSKKQQMKKAKAKFLSVEDQELKSLMENVELKEAK